jgi:hypothetical protein
VKRTLAVIVLALAPTAAHADAPADATALFEQGIKDMQGGNLEAGCKELAASLAKYSDSGTKGALATCYTRQGRITSAWNLWKDLADTAPQADDRTDAAKNAAQLEPRLPRFVVKLAGAAPAGLVVTVNGATADPTLSVPLPVDPGPVLAAAHAPDHKDWSQTYNATEGKVVSIDVPDLVELPKAPPPVTPPPTAPAVAPVTGTVLPSGPIVVREDNAAARHSRHVIGTSFALIGLAAAGVGAYFGSQASSKWTATKTDCGNGGDVSNCANLTQAQTDVSSAKTDALISTIAVSAGGALFVTGAIIFLSAPSDVERSTAALRVTPTISPSAAGLVLTGRW